MTKLEFTVEADPASQDLEALRDGLTRHALPTTGVPGFDPLAVFARDEESQIVGGVYGRLNWTWLHISLLWVASGHRSRGLGAKLLRSIESAAVERGCTRAHLDTFSYQAPSFYQSQGYRLFAELPEYPPGHRRLFLQKPLVGGDA